MSPFSRKNTYVQLITVDLVEPLGSVSAYTAVLTTDSCMCQSRRFSRCGVASFASANEKNAIFTTHSISDAHSEFAKLRRRGGSS